MEQHTLNDITNALDRHGFKWRKLGKESVIAQCPKHHGQDLNCQISINGQRAYCYCYSQCQQGFWLDEVFEEMRQPEYENYVGKLLVHGRSNGPTTGPRRVLSDFQAKDGYEPNLELIGLWKGLESLLQRPTLFDGLVDNEYLDDLGWRWIERGPYGLGTGVFIPYWSDSKRDSLKFAQVRHLTGKVRFNFVKGGKPVAYGKWILEALLCDSVEDRPPLVICEGTSDWVTLDSCSIPALALPSSVSTELMAQIAKFCHEHKIKIIYGGDNDEAGDRLRMAIDQTGIPYRVKQPPKKYKDWKDFFLAEGHQAVCDYFHNLMFPEPPDNRSLQKVIEIMGGGEVLTVTGVSQQFRQQSLISLHKDLG